MPTYEPASYDFSFAAAGVDLMNKMQQITAGLLKAGVLKSDGSQQSAQKIAS